MKTRLLNSAALAIVLTLALFISVSHAKPQLHVNPNIKTCEIELDASLTQDQFHGFIKELSSILAVKQTSSTEPLGKYAFDFGLEYAYTPVDDEAGRWNNTFTHPEADHYLYDIALFKIRARMGISDRIDGGLYYSTVPQSNVSLVGLDLKYAFDEWENVGTAVRIHYSKLFETHDVDIDTIGLDLSASRKIGRWTPYIGAGGTYSIGKENSPKVQLESEKIIQPHGFVGTDIRLSSFKLGVAVEYGSVATFTLKAMYEL